MSYIQTNQNWLLPMSIKDMIPEGHICFLVEEFAENLGYSNFDMQYDGAGHPAYHPRIIMKIIIQGMLSRIRSSRKLAVSCRENFIMMYLAEKTQPDFRTIAKFRKDNARFIKDAFKKTVEIASEKKLIGLSFISLDGSKIKAYASKKRYFNKIALDKLDKSIDKIIKEDIELDELEGELFGGKEEGLTGVDKNDLKKIVREFNKSKDKNRIKKKDVPFYFRERLRMKEKIDTKDGRMIYGLRKITVEPVIGNMKQNIGFRVFLLHGLVKVKIEMNIACIAHNLQKIWRMTATKGY
mgnify:FL=1